jgi:hypothetical protein
MCSATNVALGVPLATNDNCGLLIVTNDAPAGFPVGTNLVTWTAVDTSGNTSTCVQTVVVQDTEPPTLVCPVNLTVNADAGTCSATNVALGLPLAAGDNCGLLTVTNDAPAIFLLGTNHVTWAAVDTSGNVRTCVQTVVVHDLEPPTLVCPASVTVNADAGACSATNVALGVPLATNDNCGILTVTNNAPAVFPQGTNLVTWTVVDLSGNLRTCLQTVTVLDAEPPTIGCPASVVVRANLGTQWATNVALGVPLATNDNCGLLMVTNDAPVAFPVGTNLVTWTAVDTSGNTNACQQTVTVEQALTVVGIVGSHQGYVTITFAGGIPGSNYVLQVTTNLVTSPWTDLTTLPAGSNGQWTFDDHDKTNHVRRYYRSAQSW